MSQLSQDDLLTAQIEFQDLLAAVRQKETQLSFDTRSVGPISSTLENLGRTRVSLGPPRDSLVRLKPKLFKAVGVEFDPVQVEKMKSENFYYMTVTVSMVPGDAVQYDQLKCELAFGPEGSNAPIIHTMFPAPEWKEIMAWGAELSLGINADLSWSLVFDPENLAQLDLYNQLPAALKARANNKNQYAGYIAIPAFSYQLGRADIAATGVGNTFGFWDIQKPELKRTQTVKFGLVFKVPKTVKKVQLTGKTKAETSKNWLFSNLKPLLNSLTRSQQDFVSKGIPNGDYAEWELELPV